MVVRKFLGSNPFFQHRQFGLAGLDGFGGFLGQADLQHQADDDNPQDGPNQKSPDGGAVIMFFLSDEVWDI